MPYGSVGGGGGSGVSGSGTANRGAKWSSSTVLTNAGILDTTSGDIGLNLAPTQWVLGAYEDPTPATCSIRPVDVPTSGTTNQAGANLNLYGGYSSGTAEGGDIFFRINPAGTASGGTQNNSGTQVARFGCQSWALGTAQVRTVATSTLQGYSPLAANTAGGGLLIRSGSGTGTGTAGSMELDQYFPNAAGGSSLQSAVPIIRTDGSNAAVTFGGAGSAGNGLPSHITVPDVTLSGHIRSGTDLAGGDVVVQGGPGNGTGASGAIHFRTATAGSTGSSQNTPTTRCTIGNAGFTSFKGADVASAASIAITGNVFHVTGTTNINDITGGAAGRFVTLIFDGVLTVGDAAGSGTSNINLSAAFVSTANDTLTLVHDGNSWFEVCRSVN